MAGMAKETKTAAKGGAKAPAKGEEGTARKVNPALMKPMTPSKELGAVVGTKPLPRTEVVSKVWEYIKSNKLQNPKNGREILADDKLQKVFGTDKVTMFEMNKHLSKHLS
jgi:upstream activation factor subunit UAF30